MTVSIGAGPHSRRRVRSLALALLVGGLVLTGCDGDDPGADTEDPVAEVEGGEAADDGDAGEGGEGGGAAAPETAEPVEPPTEPMDLELVAGERSASQDGDTITVEGDRAAFVSPSGNIACVLSEERATCQIFDKTYTPDPDYIVSDVVGPCDAESANAMTTVDEGASWTCVAEPLTASARPSALGWWVPEVDGTTDDVDDLEVAILPYGQTMEVGPVSCDSTDEGVTCRNPDLGGRRIVLSRTNYRFDRNG